MVTLIAATMDIPCRELRLHTKRACVDSWLSEEPGAKEQRPKDLSTKPPAAVGVVMPYSDRTSSMWTLRATPWQTLLSLLQPGAGSWLRPM